ncbi:MAG: lipoate--protein ligase family protein [Candidatus Rokubacteria bacterium]|nr:lipoate--protein ligase family protein [Candidatus Rokubacteria bacterium]
MIRRLDLGSVPPLRSQAIYHGLAAAMAEATPDTIVFCAPAAPYFCVGYHQQGAEVLDLARCRREGWPVYRRRIGGGAVYLDGSQLFYQVIVHRSRAPVMVERIYRTYLAGPVEALRRLGLDAALRGVNEVEVDGLRIAGTGGGRLGEAVVVVGNFLFDFPARVMARAWRVPSPSFRRLAREGLTRYLTTLRRELGVTPTMARVTALLAECYEATLGRRLIPGALSAREEDAIARAEADLSADAPVPGNAGDSLRGLKIAGDTYVREHTLPTSSGVLRLTARLRGTRLDAIEIGPRRWRPLARALAGSLLTEEALLGRVVGAPEGAPLVDALLAMSRAAR